MKPTLIYCADGNPRFMKIAKDHKFLTGAQLPRKIYDVHLPLHFADQDFKRPRYVGYIRALRLYQPVMASVLDLMEWRRWDEYLLRAEEVSQYCQVVMLIPKLNGAIEKLTQQFPDRKINGKEIRLGYSVQTGYGGTDVPTAEFGDWPVHLLGGSPFEQLRKTQEMNVVSCDGNFAQLMSGYCQFFEPEGTPFYLDKDGKKIKPKNRFWPTLREASGGESWGDGSDKADANYEAFRRSCKAIMEMWENPEKFKSILSQQKRRPNARRLQ